MDLVSKTTDKKFDDTLEDIGGLALFNPKREELDKEFPWLNQADDKEWEKVATLFHGYERKPLYVRFVDPLNARFGSIARVVQYSYYYNPHTASSLTQAQKDQNTRSFAMSKNFSGELRWDGRNSKPGFYSRSDLVEWLPDWKGGTVWQFDRERSKRVKPVVALDKLGREIQVGDFCTYILYQFQGRDAAGIYFGNVTKVEKDGQVFCKNVKLTSSDRQAEMAIKNNNLITILTDDLMRQLMLAKLSNG